MRSATAAADTIGLGDKGDGTPASHTEAKQRHAHINNGHIPDMYRLGSPHDVYEFKCYLYPVPRHARHPWQSLPAMWRSRIGLGYDHSFAFGNTEETLRASVYGLTAHEAPRMISPLTDVRAWGM